MNVKLTPGRYGAASTCLPNGFDTPYPSQLRSSSGSRFTRMLFLLPHTAFRDDS